MLAGAYLALGRTDGYLTVYDVQTRNLLRALGGHVKAVTGVSWSPLNRYLASSSLDWNVRIWDLADGVGRCVRTLRFDAPATAVTFAPDTRYVGKLTSRRMLVVLASREVVLVSLSTTTAPQRTVLALPEGALCACFSPCGTYVFAGSAKGDVHLCSVRGEPRLLHTTAVGSSSVRQLALDRAGRHLVVNLNDRTLRTFSVHRPQDAPPTLSPRHKFQDLVGRTPWSGIGFSGDGEYVMGGAAHGTAHNIYLWDRDAGVLVKVLEGPREPLVSVQWHPVRAQLASITSSGNVHIWSTKATEIWSAYAPGFEELDENVVYAEREDEFDLVREKLTTGRRV